jgi:hypothetical protein
MTMDAPFRDRGHRSDKYGPEVLRAASALRDAGVRWHQIAKRLGAGADGLRRRLDPEFRAKRNVQINEAYGRRVVGRPASSSGRVPADEVRRLMASVPVDTRSQSARLFGDPMPGRSALDRREQQV